MPHVTVIGTGNMGQAIAGVLSKGGATVDLLGHHDDADVTGDIVVLAVPYPALADVASKRGDRLDGKVVVDITNPIDVEAFEPLKLEAGSAAQEIAAKAPGAKVVKAFNTTFASTLGDGHVAGQPLDVLIASDADDAKETVSRIVSDGGLRPIDSGPLKRARELEALGYLHMALQQPLGTGFSSAVKVLA
jgi:8-hydroxy-5-deazaflavin:NADPH oxidoreductase